MYLSIYRPTAKFTCMSAYCRHCSVCCYRISQLARLQVCVIQVLPCALLHLLCYIPSLSIYGSWFYQNLYSSCMCLCIVLIECSKLCLGHLWWSLVQEVSHVEPYKWHGRRFYQNEVNRQQPYRVTTWCVKRAEKAAVFCEDVDVEAVHSEYLYMYVCVIISNIYYTTCIS